MNLSSTAVIACVASLLICLNEAQTDEEEEYFADVWVYVMIGCGWLGFGTTIILTIHMLYHFSHDKVKVVGLTRIVNLVCFAVCGATCFAYALLKADLILPVGTDISCGVGYFLPVLLVTLSKPCVFAVFTLRVHLTFKGSALAYSPKRLILFVIVQGLSVTGLTVVAMVAAADAVEYRFTPGGIGVCSIGDIPFLFRLMFAIGGVGDLLYSATISWLFIRKLRELVAMTADTGRNRVQSDHEATESGGSLGSKPGSPSHRKDSKPVSPTASRPVTPSAGAAGQESQSKRRHRKSTAHKRQKSHDQNERLKKVMMKQTVLLVVAVVSSLAFWVVGAAVPQVSLLVSVDMFINVVCIWLMFRFANDVFARLVHCCDAVCCGCCGCCGNLKEDLLARMATLSRGMSIRSDLRNAAAGSSGKSKSKSTEHKSKGLTVANSPSVASVQEEIQVPRVNSGHDPIEPQMTDRGNYSHDLHLEIKNRTESLKPDDVPDGQQTPEISFDVKFKPSVSKIHDQSDTDGIQINGGLS